ncbi:unnamed protein product, partial [Discosporangium mesarthrocarpum]
RAREKLDGGVLLRLRHMYKENPQWYKEFCDRLLLPLLQLVPFSHTRESVVLAHHALACVHHHSPSCLFSEAVANDLAEALSRLMRIGWLDNRLRVGAVAIATTLLLQGQGEKEGGGQK